MDAVPVMRRGVGAIYVVAGLTHLAIMAFAVAYSQWHFAGLNLTARHWSILYFGHFLFLLVAGFTYLYFSYRQAGLFHPEPLMDFAVGVAGFTLTVSVAAKLLVKSRIGPWLAFVPGTFLCLYGLGLRQGRAVGVGPRPARPL